MTKEELEKQTMEWKNNYILKLEKENAELKEQLNKNPCVCNTEWHCNDCLALLTKAKEIIENIIRVTWGEGWNYSLDWKVKAEQFINEVEK